MGNPLNTMNGFILFCMFFLTSYGSPTIQEWEQPLFGQEYSETNDKLGSIFENTPYKLGSKRSLKKQIKISQCTIHRQTLAELYMILKEEADIFAACVEENKQSNHKRFERGSGQDGCSLYRQTLTELFEIVTDEARNYEECLEKESRNKKSLFLL